MGDLKAQNSFNKKDNERQWKKSEIKFVKFQIRLAFQKSERKEINDASTRLSFVFSQMNQWWHILSDLNRI